MSGLALWEVDGQVATLTLHRPERHNSLVPELLRDLLAALGTARTQPGLAAVVLQAAGRSFSTGGDVRGFYDRRADLAAYAGEIVGLLNQAILAMIELPVPIVAAVQGAVTGGSLGLVLAADIVLLAPEASFTPYYAVVGYSPDGGWSALLPAVIGPRRAAEALLLNRSISAAEAVEWGLANRVVPGEDLRREARAAAGVIAGMGPGSIARTRRLLWPDTQAVAVALEAERRAFISQIVTPEALRGMEAFLDI